MVYRRPHCERRLTPEEKKELINGYLDFYKGQAQQDIQNLNKKIPREAFEEFLDEIGGLLLQKSALMAENNPVVRRFLEETPLPLPLQDLLPDEFRVFCLMLNALKQWISAEQQATDRYLLGGTARATLRAVNKPCLVTGKQIGDDGELHHPVRDGRPPILLSKEGHAAIEGQTRRPPDLEEPAQGAVVRDQTGVGPEEDFSEVIREIKKHGHHSWVQLRNACWEGLGKQVTYTTPNVASTSRAFARKVSKKTGIDYGQILEWIAQNNL
jgi:hypothetical protein